MQEIRSGFWWFGCAAWSFGICDRSLATAIDSSISAIELMQLFTAGFFFVSWLFLKPEK